MKKTIIIFIMMMFLIVSFATSGYKTKYKVIPIEGYGYGVFCS